jgi:hypothetical protein
MSESNYGHAGNKRSEYESLHHELHDKVRHNPGPYWKRAHRDWVFGVGLFLILSAAIIYVLSDNLALLPGARPVHAQPNAVER